MLVKKDIIQTIANRTKLSQKDVGDVLETHAEVVLDGLRSNNEVSLVGLGKLAPVTKAGRTARNPKTGQTVEVLPSIGVKFKVATVVKAALN